VASLAAWAANPEPTYYEDEKLPSVYFHESFVRQVVPAFLRSDCVTQQRVCDDLDSFTSPHEIAYNLFFALFGALGGGVTARIFTAAVLKRENKL
jgi:hypothetical protein